MKCARDGARKKTHLHTHTHSNEATTLLLVLLLVRNHEAMIHTANNVSTHLANSKIQRKRNFYLYFDEIFFGFIFFVAACSIRCVCVCLPCMYRTFRWRTTFAKSCDLLFRFVVLSFTVPRSPTSIHINRI